MALQPRLLPASLSMMVAMSSTRARRAALSKCCFIWWQRSTSSFAASQRLPHGRSEGGPRRAAEAMRGQLGVHPGLSQKAGKVRAAVNGVCLGAVLWAREV